MKAMVTCTRPEQDHANQTSQHSQELALTGLRGHESMERDMLGLPGGGVGTGTGGIYDEDSCLHI